MDLKDHFNECFNILSEDRENNEEFYEDNEICFEKLSEGDVVIPEELSESITPQRNEEYKEILCTLSDHYNGYMDLSQMGNILKWTFFTDFVESELTAESGIGLIVKLEHPFPVCILIGTDCNDILMEQIYDNINDYFIDYNKWKELPEPTEDDLVELKEFIKDYRYPTPVDRNYIANKVTTFVEYISVIKDQLPLDIDYVPIEN